MNLSNNKILITGGATGIGFGLAERFIKENNTVIICGRRPEALASAKNKLQNLITKQCDLTIESERIELLEWLKKNHPDVNVIVNNAGIQNWMNLEDGDFFEKAKQEISINIEALIHMSSLSLQLTSLNTIMNVSSGLSYVPLIKTPVYSATKAFVRSFTTSMRQLLLAKNIEVIEIIPPALNTDLGGVGLHDYAPPVSDFIESIFEQLKEGKNRLTFGMSEMMAKANPDELQVAFTRMNQVTS